MWIMKRKEAWWVDFDPSLGGEIQKKRPAVIVSNDTANRFLNRVQVVPVTSKIERVYPGECHVTLNKKKCKALANQITTVTKKRLREKISMLSDADMVKIEQAIRTQLELK